MLTEEPLELVKSREVTPIIEIIRAKLPMDIIADVEMTVTDPLYHIDNDIQETLVSGYMRDAATWEATVTKEWAPLKGFWHSIHAACCAAEKETAPAIGRIRERCNTLMKDWIRRKQEAERARQALLDKAVERDRKIKEQQARAAAFDGQTDKAEALIQEAAALRAPVIMAAPTKLEGTSITPKFIGKVTDQMKLITAIAMGQIPLMHDVKGKDLPLLLIDHVVLQFYVSKLGKQLNWPGVEIEEDIALATRKRS